MIGADAVFAVHLDEPDGLYLFETEGYAQPFIRALKEAGTPFQTSEEPLLTMRAARELAREVEG